MISGRKNNTIVVLLMVLAFATLFFQPAAVFSAQELKGEAGYLPWSGWWWPKHDGELVLGYNGRPSPAEKYDLYVTGRRPGTAQREGLHEWYDLEAPSWYGLCNGWVNASILERGAILPASSNGVFLTVGDKKGLLSACHFKDEIIYEYCWGSPEPFHRYLINHIGEQGEIIGADLDSSDTFWSYPIYSYEMTITSGINSDHVVCTIKHADDFVDPDYQGSKEVTRTYIYRLDKSQAGNYTGGGEWLQGDPGGVHPQSVWVPVGIRQDQLFVEYEAVRQMAETVDDESEGLDLVPGHHLLIVYPGEEDTFTIQPLAGETITCSLSLDPQSAPGNSAGYSLECNNEVVQAGDLSSDEHQLILDSETAAGPMQLRILPGPDNSAGVCVHLYVSVDAPYQSWFYGFPAELYWLGCAVVTDLDSPNAKAWLEIVGDQGLPLGRGNWSGESLKQGGRWVTGLDNSLTEDYFNGDGQAIGIKLVSSTPFKSLLLAGTGNRVWGPPAASEVMGNRLVIPCLTSGGFNAPKLATLHLANHNTGAVITLISYYKNDGTQLQTVEVELAPEMIVEYGCGNYPWIGGLDGWGVIESSGAEFCGAVDLREGSIADQLPLLLPGRDWLVSHLAIGSGWQTHLVVCNPNSQPLQLSLSAFVAGAPLSVPYLMVVEPFARVELNVTAALFGVNEALFKNVWLKLNGDLESAAYLQYRYDDLAGASIPLYADVKDENTRKLSHLAVSHGWWTGIVLTNRSAEAVTVTLSALDKAGEVLQRLPLTLGPWSKYAANVTSLFAAVADQGLASLRIVGAEDIKALAVYGGFNGVLSAKCW